MGQMNHRPSVWCSKYYFFFLISCKILCKNPFNYFFHKFTKIKSFECPKSIRNYEKIMLGTSDAWSTSHLSHRSSEPAYYIVDCRILIWLRCLYKNLNSLIWQGWQYNLSHMPLIFLRALMRKSSLDRELGYMYVICSSK